MNANTPNPLDQIGDICTQMLLSYDKFAKQYHISGNELAILYTLWVDGDCTQKHIADKCQIAKQTIHTLCKKYETDGILVSQTSLQDKREKTLQFTATGRQFAQNIIEPLLAQENQAIADFGVARAEFLLNEFKILQTLLSQKLEQHHG